MDHTLYHCKCTIADVDRQPQFALWVHAAPDPLGRTLQACDGFGHADRTILHRAEQGEEFIELYLPDPHVVQDVSGKGPQLVRRYQPLKHRIGVDLKDPRRPRIPRPSARHAMTRTMRSTEVSLNMWQRSRLAIAHGV
jgi:hypothetical protein